MSAKSVLHLSTTRYTREKACFKRNEPFLVCVFRRLAYPGHASTLPEGRSDFLNAPFLSTENHSLGEWFKRSLVAIMQKKKLVLV